jgi:hypothetical protein
MGKTNQRPRRVEHLRWTTRLEWFARGEQLQGNRNFVRRAGPDYVQRRFESKWARMQKAVHRRCASRKHCFEWAGLRFEFGNAWDVVHRRTVHRL